MSDEFSEAQVQELIADHRPRCPRCGEVMRHLAGYTDHYAVVPDDGGPMGVSVRAEEAYVELGLLKTLWDLIALAFRGVRLLFLRWFVLPRRPGGLVCPKCLRTDL